ncbi:MAG: LysR family transcriptional regulator [Burkholderiaceae bacterium]
MRPVADLQLLRTFVAIARSGSLSAASRRLHLSQPALSLQLKALTGQTGLALFSRKARGLQLTAEGGALLPHAQRVLASVDDFNAAVGRLHRTLRGTLRIGTILDPPFIRLGAFLKRLVEIAPQVEIECAQAMSGTVLDLVRDGALDVGFHLQTRDEPADPAIASTRLIDFSYFVVAPPGWESAVHGRDWAGLAELPWLATPAQSAHHRLQARLYGPGSLTGLTPRRVARVDQEATMTDLVKSGVGLSLMRDSIALAESQAHGLVIADQVSLACSLHFVHQAARCDDPVIATARQALAGAWETPVDG